MVDVSFETKVHSTRVDMNTWDFAKAAIALVITNAAIDSLEFTVSHPSLDFVDQASTLSDNI